jgi:hypothetical protein
VGACANYGIYSENRALWLISNSLVPLLLKGKKGLQLPQFLKQIFAFIIDGTSVSISYFDKLKQDGGLKSYVQPAPLGSYSKQTNGKVEWAFLEFANRPKSWAGFRRCIFIKRDCDAQGQYMISFDKPDNMIYTNIGTCPAADRRLKGAGGEKYFEALEIMKLSHARGTEELIHRGLKELATGGQLPFKRMGMNRAYYYLLVIAHFILETYKRDITADVTPITSYPNTFRRGLVDFAVKLTSHSREILNPVIHSI